MEDVLVERVFGRGGDVRVPKQLGIPPRVPASCVGPPGQVRQLCREDGCLKGVDPLAVADFIVLVLARSSMVAELPDAGKEIRVVARHGSGVAVRPKVLAGIEAEARNRAERPDGLAMPARAVRLGSVLD